MSTDTASGTMHIGELADKSRLSLRAIRHYDDTGLLEASGRTNGGFRHYTQKDVSRLILIRRMKPLGFTLEETVALLQVIDTLQSGGPGSDNLTVRSALESFINQVVERRRDLQSQLQMTDESLDLLRRQSPVPSRTYQWRHQACPSQRCHRENDEQPESDAVNETAREQCFQNSREPSEVESSLQLLRG